MIKTLITLTAFYLIGCGSEYTKKERFEVGCDIGKLTYESILLDAIKNDSVIDFKKIDSIFEVRKIETSNKLYK